MSEPSLLDDLRRYDIDAGIDLALALHKTSRPRRQKSALKGAATKRTLAALARAA